MIFSSNQLSLLGTFLQNSVSRCSLDSRSPSSRQLDVGHCYSIASYLSKLFVY